MFRLWRRCGARSDGRCGRGLASGSPCERKIRAVIMQRRRLAAFGASLKSGWLCHCRPSRSASSQLKPWRIAVLGRAKSHLSAVIAEFKKDYGDGPIPYRAIDLDPLDELPEVLDALALTRALLHPSDRIAWLAVLHAPWCGLGLGGSTGAYW